MLIYKLVKIYWLIHRNDYIMVVQELYSIFFLEKKKVPEDGVAHCTLNCGVDVTVCSVSPG